MGHLKKIFAIILIHIFNRFPIKKNKLFLFSYYGAQYGCNPKYISEYINEHYPKETFDVVWAFNNVNSKSHVTDVRKVKTMSIKYFYELCTSKVIITNFRTTDLFIKRKNQYYIQTWHSSLRLKQIEKDAENVLPPSYIQMATKDSMKCDLLLSGCKYSTNIFRKSFWYGGEIFEHGTPRNDLLFQANNKRRGQVLRKLLLPRQTKVLLYAPTFRKNNSLEVYDLNYEQILQSLRHRFGGEWVILVKLHPHLLLHSSGLLQETHVIDVTAYDDIQELLFVADILISDYSSLMFDFAITKRPCFLYLPDVKEYTAQDRQLYFDLKELPFIGATSNDELLRKIENYDKWKYRIDLEKFLNKIGSYESGKASENLLKRIEEICLDKKRSELYEAI